MDAIRGTNKKVMFDQTKMCNACSGLGRKDSANFTVCPLCKGTGKQHYKKANFIKKNICLKCNGEGKIINEICE